MFTYYMCVYHVYLLGIYKYTHICIYLKKIFVLQKRLIAINRTLNKSLYLHTMGQIYSQLAPAQTRFYYRRSVTN